MSKLPIRTTAATAATAAPVTKPAIEQVINVTLSLKPLHLNEFERARDYIEKIYGASPPVENLMHLCLCKGALEIVQIFHATLREITESEMLLDLEELDEEGVLSL